jgi:hypothetical protein
MLTALIVNVMISDQYGTTKDIIVGVFEDRTKLNDAHEKLNKIVFRTQVHIREEPFQQDRIDLNKLSGYAQAKVAFDDGCVTPNIFQSCPRGA